MAQQGKDEISQVLDPLAHPLIRNDRVEPAGLLELIDYERSPLFFQVSTVWRLLEQNAVKIDGLRRASS